MTALLNSRVAIWYAFHGTASYGSDRPEVKQAELLRLPFPAPSDLPDPERAEAAQKELIEIIDTSIRSANGSFVLNANDDGILGVIDQLSYQYFCLSEDEIALIEDTVNLILPAIQPHEGAYPELWKAPTASERKEYATTLVKSVRSWLKPNSKLTACLEACSKDLGILRLSIEGKRTSYSEAEVGSVAVVLERIAENIHQPLSGNFQLIPDLRVFVDDSLYLIKPMQKRFWLRAKALGDADAIAMDLQDAIETNRQRSHA